MGHDTLPGIRGSGNKTIVSHPEFGQGTNGTEVAEAFAEGIKGKTSEHSRHGRRQIRTNIPTVVITGVSTKSLGETLATALARHSPTNLILASRTLSKLESVASLVKKASPLVKPRLVVLNLGSQKAIRKAATEISQLVSHVDILINNAAIVSSERRETTDGLEQTFGTNHVGHWLFTSLLTPLLLTGAERSS